MTLNLLRASWFLSLTAVAVAMGGGSADAEPVFGVNASVTMNLNGQTYTKSDSGAAFAQVNDSEIVGNATGIGFARGGQATGPPNPNSLVGFDSEIRAQDGATGQVTSTASWTDQVWLIAGPNSPPFTSLMGASLEFRFKVGLGGLLSITNPGDPDSVAKATISLASTGDSGTGLVSRAASGVRGQSSATGSIRENSGDWETPLTTMYMDVPLNPGNPLGPITWSLTAEATAMATHATEHVFATGSPGLTALLIKLPGQDAVTPESLGFGVGFLSGMQSPNPPAPAAVPEPATLGMWASASLILLAHATRRRRVAGAKPSRPENE